MPQLDRSLFPTIECDGLVRAIAVAVDLALTGMMQHPPTMDTESEACLAPGVPCFNQGSELGAVVRTFG